MTRVSSRIFPADVASPAGAGSPGSALAAAPVLGAGVAQGGQGSAAVGSLSGPRAAALYIGALLGPGLLLLPGLAAAEAGPASILAWLGLLCLSGLFAVVFAGLGRAYPAAGGVSGYAAAGLGPRAGALAGVSFLVGVIAGAPLVCLIGAGYVTELTGGGTALRCVIAAALLLVVVLALASGGLRASTTVQLVLVSLLTAVIVAAVIGAAPAARAANWVPFAPHGWASLGRAAATLMFSFVGWEAVAPLTGRFRDPGRQLPRVIGTALAVTTVLYLGLAIATIAVLGRGAATDVPLAGLLTRAVGGEGRLAAAVVAVVLTLGTTNAYLSGAVAMAREFRWGQPGQAARWQRRAVPPPVMSGRLSDHGPSDHGPSDHGPSGHGPSGHGPSGHGPSGHGVRSGRGVPSDHPQRRADYLEGQAQHPERPAGHGSERAFLTVIAAVGVILLALYGAGLVTAAELVGVPTTLFLVVYLCCTLSAVRTLRGAARGCAVAAFAAVAGLLAFCGWSLALAAVVTIAALHSGGRHPRGRFRLRS